MTKPRHFYIWLVRCVLFMVCAVIMMQPAAAATQQDSEEMTCTSKIRNRPSYDATVIGCMEEGTEVTILEDHGDFYKIDCYDMTGFIAKEQVEFREESKCYVNCKEESQETELLEYVSYSQALLLRHALLNLAQEQLGVPYVYGGKSPRGFDCSGFTYYLYGNHDFALHRTASQQLQDGIIVAKEGMQVGDLVFFREDYETYPASHVGIYAGNNRIIHAGRNGICYSDLDSSYYSEYFLCARRIVNTQAAKPDIQAAHPRTIQIFEITQSVSGRQVG